MTTGKSDNLRFKDAGQTVFDAMVSRYYDLVLEYNTENGLIEFLRISDSFMGRGFTPEKIKSFDELNKHFIEEMLVLEERETYIEQVTLPCILEENQSKECYVRTVHINTADGIKAESLRITPIQDTENFLVCLTDISMVLDRDWMTDEYSRSGFISRTTQLLKDPKYQKDYQKKIQKDSK